MDAKPWLTELSTEVKRLETFADVLAVYVAKSPAFSHKHWIHVRRLEKDLGECRLALLPQALENYLLHKRTHDTVRGKPLSDASANRIVAVTHAAYEKCLKLEYLHHNPISDARFPKFELFPRDRVLTADERDRLFRLLPRVAPHLEAICRYAYRVPSRTSELVNARRDSLDMQRKDFWVPHGTTKSGKGIWKPIPPDMQDYFEAPPKSSPWIFYRLGRYGEPLNLGCFKKSWAKVLRAAGITNFRFHDFRHIAVTNMINAGTPERIVMQIAGWKTPMFSTYYARGGREALGQIRWAHS